MLTFRHLLTAAVFVFSGMPVFANQSDCPLTNFREYDNVPNIGYVKMADVTNDCEFLPQLWLGKGSNVSWYKTGEVMSVQYISRQSVVDQKFTVNPGGTAHWHKNGQLYYVDFLKNDTELLPGIWALRRVTNPYGASYGGAVNFRTDGRIWWISTLAKDLLSGSAIVAKRCQEVTFGHAGSVKIGLTYSCNEKQHIAGSGSGSF